MKVKEFMSASSREERKMSYSKVKCVPMLDMNKIKIDVENEY